MFAMPGMGIGIAGWEILGTKGAVLAERMWRLLTEAWLALGAPALLGAGPATDRDLNTADTPSPNSNSGLEFLGVRHTGQSPGRGPGPEAVIRWSRGAVSEATRSLMSRNWRPVPFPGPGLPSGKSPDILTRPRSRPSSGAGDSCIKLTQAKCYQSS